MAEYPLNWLIQALVSFILLWGIGSLVAFRLIPRSYSHDFFLVSPFLGFAAIAAVCIYLGTLGLPSEQFAWILFLAGGIGLVVARRQIGISLRRRWKVIAICIATYILAMLPLISLGYLTTVGGTIDGISYAVRSEYLQAAGLVRPVTLAGHPFYDWVAAHIDALRVGDVYFVSLVGALSGARSYQLLTTTAGLFYAIMPAGVFVLARRTFQLKETAALWAACLTGTHNLLLWAVYDNFLSQTVAASLFPLLLSFEIRAVHTQRWRETVVFAALLAALISAYPIYALPVVVFGMFYVGMLFVRQVRRRRAPALTLIMRYLIWTVLAAAVTLAWNGPAIWRAYKELTLIGTLLGPEAMQMVGPGNITVFPQVPVFAGLAAHASLAYNLGAWQLPDWLLWTGALLWAGGVVVGALRLSPAPRLGAASALLVVVGLLLQQRYGVDPPRGYPYGYFKIAFVVVLAALPLFAHAVYTLAHMRPLRNLAWLFLICVAGLNVFNSLWTIDYVLRDRIVLERKVIEVAQGLRGVSPSEWILLDLQPGLAQNWLGYLLKDHPIRFREPILLWSWAVTDVAPTVFHQYALVERSVEPQRAHLSSIDEPWYSPQGYEATWRNERYELRHRSDAAVSNFQFQAGQGNWAAGDSLQIHIDVPNGRLQARLGAAQPIEHVLSGRPRTLQMAVLVFTSTAQLRIADIPMDLSPGVWIVDIAPDATDPIVIQNSGAVPVLLHRLKALAVDTGDPADQLEVVQRPEGMALVTQSAAGATLTYEINLVRPAGDEASVYRLALHIIEPETLRYFGTWGLDFSQPVRVQRGRLLLDLEARTAQGMIGDAQAPVEAGLQQVEHGHFETQVVWWRLGQTQYLSLCRCAYFDHVAGSPVQMKEHRAYPAPVTIITPP